MKTKISDLKNSLDPKTRLILYEDEHILVINKPPGWNTHAASPYATAGVYEWMRDSQPERAALSIVHRLDKQTSGILVFPKSDLARRTLTPQFMQKEVHREYVFLSHVRPRPERLRVTSYIRKAKGKFESCKHEWEGEEAITEFEFDGEDPVGYRIRARPLTGRTHQIRLHAADAGFPVLGDTLYGGRPYPRLCLHAAALQFRHPVDNRKMSFQTEPDFSLPQWMALRLGLMSLWPETDTVRLVHGVSDGYPGLYVDRYGPVLVFTSEKQPPAEIVDTIASHAGELAQVEQIYWKRRDPLVQKACPEQARPVKLAGDAPGERTIQELGLRYLIRMDEGYSVGLFLDQRDNRRRILAGYVGRGFPYLRPHGSNAECLNLFSYTCSFSVCAAKVGWHTVSVDLSKRYLEWGMENFCLNGLDPAQHEFYRDDVWEMLRRLKKKGRRFGFVILDQPTFSRSKRSGVFRAREDYRELVRYAVDCVEPGGVVLASCNTVGWKPEQFIEAVEQGVRDAGRRIAARYYCTQPPDFPSTTGEPAYLKCLWLQLDERGAEPGN